MNTLCIILLIVAIIIALPFIAALFTSPLVVMENEVIINKPKQEVFDYIKLLKNEEYYNKWVMMDPNSKKTFTGTDGTVGFVYRWESENKQVGTGEQEIKKITSGERIDSEIRFIKPMNNIAQSYMTTESVSANQTKVRWVFSGTRDYMMRVMYILLNLKKALGRDFAAGLANLKHALEQ